jgi:cysteinyl-tRNA synthetase
VAPLGDAAAPAGEASGEQTAIEDLCRQLDDARKRKDFAAADGLRAEITKQGYDVKTSPNGTIAEKRLA